MTTTDRRRAMDAQLRFSDILADFQHWRDANVEASAGVDPTTCTRVTWGEDARQWVETTGSLQASPIVPVFIHGGYWRAGEVADHRFFAAALARHFGCAANLEYRLMPAARMADLVADARGGLRAVLNLLQPEQRVLVLGHSAGGHLACFASRVGPDRVCGTVALSALADLAPIRDSFLQDELHLTTEEVATFGPLAEPNRPVAPCWALTGEDETPIFHEHASRLAEVSGGSSARVADAHHMSVLHRLADSAAFMNGLSALASGNAPPDRVA